VGERANGYLETSFLPGRAFTSAADFNAQLIDWLVTIANRALTPAPDSSQLVPWPRQQREKRPQCGM
jgi:hypothetical protein